MDLSELRKTMETQRRTLLVLWISFLPAMVIYLILATFVIPPPHDSSGVLRAILWILALSEVGLLYWWKGKYLTKKSFFAGLRQPNPAVLYLKNYIIAFAIAESVAIWGLVLAMVGGYRSDQYALTFLSAFLLIQVYPPKIPSSNS